MCELERYQIIHHKTKKGKNRCIIVHQNDATMVNGNILYIFAEFLHICFAEFLHICFALTESLFFVRSINCSQPNSKYTK